jgi:uncharacterized protein (DUF362 family)
MNELSKPVVAIIQCDRYSDATVAGAFGEMASLFPELAEAFTCGTTVLLKPDVSGHWKNAWGMFTHYTIVKQAAAMARGRGAGVVIGDTPAHAAWPMWHRFRHLAFQALKGKYDRKTYPELESAYRAIHGVKVLQDAAHLGLPINLSTVITGDSLGIGNDIDFYEGPGLTACARETNAQLVYFETGKFVSRVPFHGRFLSAIPLPEKCTEVARVVSMPRLMQFDATNFAGAIRNLASLLPVARREVFETTAHLAGMTGEYLADILSCFDPLPLAIADAVEVLGPEGNRCCPGIILAGNDCIAVDTVLAHLLRIEPVQVPELRACYDRGLGTPDMSRIEVRGMCIDAARERFAGALTTDAKAGAGLTVE